MATITDILALINLNTGESSFGSFGNWGAVADENFRLLELAAGEVVSKTVTTTDVSLSDDEHNSLLIKATGVLTGNRAIETKDRKGFWFVSNGCTGAFTLTVKTDSGTGIVVPQGGWSILVSDGTNMLQAATTLDATALAVLLDAATGKTTPVDADTMPLIDSAASNVLKKVTWANIKATLKTYFDSVTTTLTNKTLTSPVLTTPQINDTTADHRYVFAVSELAADRTVTLPLLTAADVFVFADFIQTLKNKKLEDGTTTIVGSADATKAVKFEVDGLTTATTRTVTVPDKNGTMAMTSDVVFTQSFESSQQTITSGGSLTLAHGLAAQPKLYAAFLKCTTAEIGYSIGDEVAINPNVGSPGENGGLSLVPDATNVNVRFGSNANALSLVRKDTGQTTGITNASWRLIVRAWA